MVEKGEIDKDTVDIVKDNFSRINDVRIKAQQEELHDYNAFLS